MPINRLIEYLDKNQVKYSRLTHSSAYTAMEVAASAHIPGKEIAKTVIIKLDGKMVMVVLPASYNVNFELLKKMSGATTAELASEMEFKDKFPDCDIGAMPPFGNLYDMDVFVAEKLTEDREIAFNAGSHTDLIKLSYTDYEKLVKPKRMKLSTAY
jgi:Ala-tRNA(Pro) deacylase